MFEPYDAATDHSHWDAGLWTRVLAASGVRNPLTGAPFTEAMLAGLAGGIGFMIFTFNYKQTTTASAVVRFHPGPYTENLLHRSGAPVHIQQTGSAALAQSRLDAALGTGVPAVVRLVHGQLPWVNTDSAADAESVDVVVVAREDGHYLVDDGGSRLGRVSQAELAQARGARKADKHWQAHVAVGREPDGDPLTAAVLRQAMLETAQELLSEQAPAGIPPGFAKNFGIRGMHTWAQHLADTSSKRGWPRLFADPERATEGLGMLHKLLTGRRFSGPGALRPLYSQFLREAALAAQAVPGVDLAALDEAATHYKVLGLHWDDVAAMVGAADAPDFAVMALKVQAIAELETAAAQALREAAGEGL